MSTTARSPRARRGRVMIVGHLPELSSITSQLLQPPVLVKNLFEALGEATIAPAGSPIATVLISDQCLQRPSGHAIESLRKVDPSLRVILIAPRKAVDSATGMPPGLASEDFDDCVLTPLRPNDLARLFDEEMLRPETGVGEPAASEQFVVELPPSSAPGDESPGPPPAPPAALVVDLSAAPGTPSKHSVKNIVFDLAPAPPAPASPPEITHGLGDTDLLEAIMTGPEGVRSLALLLMIQQTRWADLTFTEAEARNAGDPADVAASPRSVAATASVVFRGRCFGVLRTAMSDAAQLQPWADWLARWLWLDDSYHGYRQQALQDELTGAWNRRFFNSFMKEAISEAAKVRRPVTVMVFDIDNFKTYNDQFGHEAGDEVLRETVRLLNSVIRQGDRVCRIGGDEFAVVFADAEGPREIGSKHPETVEAIARRFQNQICTMRFPKLGKDAPGNLSISAGLASYPWDGHDPETLLNHADQLALQSKRSGKNAMTFGPGAQASCGESSKE